VIGSVLVGFAHYSQNAPLPEFFSLLEGIHGNAMSSLVLGHIFFAFNGVFLVVLGGRKLDRIRRKKWAIAMKPRAQQGQERPKQ